MLVVVVALAVAVAVFLELAEALAAGLENHSYQLESQTQKKKILWGHCLAMHRIQIWRLRFRPKECSIINEEFDRKSCSIFDVLRKW